MPTPAPDTRTLSVATPTLEIGYEESGPADGPPVILLHGFPDDVRTWDGAVGPLAADGCRVIVPWLRGYGPTRFTDAMAPRSGQQAALGADLRAFMAALGIERATLGGYDWGGRAACILAALRPERVRGLLTITGYNIQNIPASLRPAGAADEYRYWYQWYFHTERGRVGLEQNRRDICRLLWRLWSPNWRFGDETFDITADSFDNPDFVDVVIHSYRHRHRAAPGDPALEPIEARLAGQPPISVPTIVLHGEADGVDVPENSAGDSRHFTGPYRREVVPVAGHFLPRETPEKVVEAIRELLAGTEA
ncbi:MAG: alpha/beta hydrolase [Proteobacteria bacterium]|nr:alpha/beta hydrolase [Pseudomonadota bacterium]